MPDNQLVKEINNALYSSLDIEKSLHETVLLLKDYIPLDLIHVFIMDRSTKTMRYLAEATTRRGSLIDERLQLPDKHFAEIKNQYHGEIRILTKSSSPLLKTLHDHFLAYVKKPLFIDSEDFSVITTGFDIGAPLVGGVGLVARGQNRFSEKHVKKVDLIRRPLIGAVLNLLHHRDIVAKNEQLTKENQALESRLGHISTGEIIGADSGLKEVTAMVSQVAVLDSPVLVLGETGTGKEIIATAIHQTSRRSDGPIIRVNCGAIPESLMDSELFGHEKGAFTGATHLKRGYFEQADGGTVFLDEIGDLPLSAQVKLLRVLQTMEFHRVGGTWPVSVDVRVVAATNRNLPQMVLEKKFREDLWFRLNVFPINIPPLRDRKQDIPALTEYCIIRKSREMNLPHPPSVSEKAISQLTNYNWPGNIRELQNVIERALILGRGKTLIFDKLLPEPTDIGIKKKAQENHYPILPMDEVIKNHITHAIHQTHGKIEGRSGAAELLKMNPSTLRSRMKKFGIIIEKSVR